MVEKYNLEFHHIGCLTKNIEETKKTYLTGLGIKDCSETFHITSQKVKVCFLKNLSDTYLELVEPMDDNAPLTRLMNNKNIFYHLGYLTGDFEATINHLISNEYILVTQFNSEAFSNKLCAFLYSPEKHFIEIIQK